MMSAELQVMAERKLRGVASGDSEQRTRSMLQAAQRASTAKMRVVWLQRAVDAYVAPLMPVAACRQGCSHCCHIPVLITEHEARRLGEVVGRKVLRPDSARSAADLSTLESQAEIDTHVAPAKVDGCPFLTDGRCSVYESRPFMCRAQVSLADDGDLCDTATRTEVPYVDTLQLKAIFLAAQPTALIADIRDWFPRERELRRDGAKHSAPTLDQAC